MQKKMLSLNNHSINKIFKKLYLLIIDFFYVYGIKLKTQKTGENKNSVSTFIKYTATVQSFLESDKRFRRFRQSPFYKIVLEHVDMDLANKYLKQVNFLLEGENFNPYFNAMVRNDSVGSPDLLKFDFGSVSGTSLRYCKVYIEIKTLFNMNHIKDIAEIGGGYGGQALIFDTLHQPLIKYKIFDLPVVVKLIERYLNSYFLNTSFSASDINFQSKQKKFDLVISNYAFSELPRNLQEIYMSKVILNSRSGYLTMNTGLVKASEKVLSGEKNIRKFTSEELIKIIPGARLIEETPLTSENNYIIVWGTN